MGTLDTLAWATEQLVAEVQRLHMAQTVQRSGYLLLARHLVGRGWVHPATLAGDVETMGQAQPDADWQDGHAALADALRLVCAPVPVCRPAQARC
nr:hypothetical protein [uncultured Albidiferax sp.]